MKLVTIILLFLTKLAFSTDIRYFKEEKLNKNPTRKIRDGSGSMTEGFILPGFYLVDNNSKGNSSGSLVSPDAKFHPKQLMNPKENNDFEKIGLVFTIEKFDKKLSPIMFPTDKKNEYYLPFRFINSEPHFNPSSYFLTNKSIDFLISTDQNSSYSFYIVFPYKLLGYYISDAEAITLTSILNEKRKKEIISVKENLIELKKKANDIINKQSLILKSNEKAESLEVQTKIFTDKIENLTKTLNTLNSELPQVEKSIENQKSKKLSMDQNLEGLTSQLNSLNLEIASNEELMKSLSNTVSAESNKQLNTKLKEEVATENKSIKEIIEALKKLMPDKVSRISNIETTYEKDNAINVTENFLLSITPRINAKNEKSKAK